jgi:tellurite resistance protein TerC
MSALSQNSYLRRHTVAMLADFLSMDLLGTPMPFWLAFAGVVITLLVIDLGVLHRNAKEITARESFILYGCYMAIAFVFGGWVWWARGAQSGLEFFTGYVIEQSLAMDNIFVMAMIFGSLAIPRIYQHRVLFWGIIGVILFRAILIGVGAALVTSFSWILYVFGVFLVFTGIKMFAKQEDEPGIEKNAFLILIRKYLRVSKTLHGDSFLVRLSDANSGKIKTFMTPLLLALILVEIIDLVFAVDSVPAVFAITQDPFIVYTSNIFAVLGLRSLYFALAAAMHRFKYLQISLAVLLVLVGCKIFLVPMGIKIDTLLSLLVTVGVLGCGILYSLWHTRDEKYHKP